jgi:hypothetical protein
MAGIDAQPEEPIAFCLPDEFWQIEPQLAEGDLDGKLPQRRPADEDPILCMLHPLSAVNANLHFDEIPPIFHPSGGYRGPNESFSE